MKCSDLQFNLPLYVDGHAASIENQPLKAHLSACPQCRQKYDEYREIRSGLRQMARPEISVALRNSLKDAVRAELRVQKQTVVPVSTDIREWLQMRVMPFGIGVFASLLVGVTFLSMMFSGMLKPGELPIAKIKNDPSIMLASNSNPFRENDPMQISPADFAQTRLAYSSESPSINPQGALIALTKSLVRGGMKDDEVVVVADVFSNGLAQIAEVVEPSRDKKAVEELEKALDSDSTYAPFVPSNIEKRPDSVRVVLKFQSVDVSTSSKPSRHRL
ncbi:hypothetical protein BH10ACI3_BH10ACI3_22560 [soil metagenome]